MPLDKPKDFVLTPDDPHTPCTIRFYAQRRLEAGTDLGTVQMMRQWAETVEKYQKEKEA